MQLSWYMSLYFLAHLMVAAAVEITVVKTNAIGKSGNKFRMTGRCIYNLPESMEKAQFTIELNKTTTKFKSRHVIVVSTDGDDYRVTNKKLIRKKFKVVFSVVYFGAETPAGNCTELEIITNLYQSHPLNPSYYHIPDFGDQKQHYTSRGMMATTSSTTSSTTTTPTEPTPTELLGNSDMESDFTGNWFCPGGCTLQSTNDSYTGSLAAKITNRNGSVQRVKVEESTRHTWVKLLINHIRNRAWEGLSQNVNITAGSRYSLSGFIKLLNVEPGSLYHGVELTMACANDQGHKEYLKFGTDIMVQPEVWTEIGAVLTTPEGHSDCMVYFKVSGVTTDYVADHMSLHHIPDDTEWMTKAQSTIENNRKAEIIVRIDSPNALPNNLEIEVIQKRHEFAFGSAVGAVHIVDPAYQAYQQFFYDNFEWAVLENSLKWKQMEKIQGEVNYERSINAIDALRTNGIKIRGHNVFWGVEKNVLYWVKELDYDDLLEAMSSRIAGVIGRTKGLLEHWDVNNENLHGDYYEQRTGDPNITMEMFRDIHAVDQDVKLFLNDFAIIETRGQQKATAIKEQALRFKTAGVPIYGIGIQSHIKNADLDITSMKTRLDKLSEAGLPLWITEFSIEEEDENKKAKALEDLLTLYFGYPAVEGILFWGFWDGKIFENSARLVEGPDLQPNAAGRAYQTLFHQTWRTKENHLVLDDNPVLIKGFKGDYDINVKLNGDVIKTETFVLGNDGVTLDISLQ